jgi:Spy/CpxP family protein refolding chaperone
MKKLFLLAVIVAMVATTAVAQDSKAQGPSKQNHTEWEKKLKDELKLTPEQLEKYDVISAGFNAKFEALSKDESIDKAAQKEKKMALKKEKETKILEILTPEQQTKYKELVEAKKAEMKKASSSQ